MRCAPQLCAQGSILLSTVLVQSLSPQMVLRPSFLPVSMLDFLMAIVFQASIGNCGMKGICFSFLMFYVSMWDSSQRRSEDNLTGWFFSSVTWVLGIEIRSSGLAASALTQLSNLASLEGHNFLIWWTGVPFCLTPLPSPPDQIFKPWSLLHTRAKAMTTLSYLAFLWHPSKGPLISKGLHTVLRLRYMGSVHCCEAGVRMSCLSLHRAVSWVWTWHLTHVWAGPFILLLTSSAGQQLERRHWLLAHLL